MTTIGSRAADHAEAADFRAPRTPRVLGWTAATLALAGVGPAGVAVHDGRLLWTLVPVLSAAGVCWLVTRRGFAAVWLLTGVSLGFVVLGAWSIGLFFAPSALLLIATAIGHTASNRAGWQLLLVPAWMLLGPTGLCALFFVRDHLLAALEGAQLTEAPAIVAGAQLFVGLFLLLVVAAGMRWWAMREQE